MTIHAYFIGGPHDLTKIAIKHLPPTWDFPVIEPVSFAAPSSVSIDVHPKRSRYRHLNTEYFREYESVAIYYYVGQE